MAVKSVTTYFWECLRELYEAAEKENEYSVEKKNNNAAPARDVNNTHEYTALFCKMGCRLPLKTFIRNL